MAMTKVTIQDVAKELGLSRNTVAKALNNSDKVSYETRFLVIEKAYEMGYSKLSPVVLNQFKIQNKAASIKTIVVLARRELSVFWNSIILGISDELNKHGCKLQLDFISEQDEKNLVTPLVLQSDISGIIILSVFSDEYIEKIIQKNIPVVFLDGPVDLDTHNQCGDIVLCEGRNSVGKITRALIEKGYRKIGFIGDITYCKAIHERYLGYVDALSGAGLPLDESIIASYHAKSRFYTTEDVRMALNRFAYIPEAIVCANDDIALDVVKCLRERGVSVPEEVAVTGYDNVEEISQPEPFLTTVKIDIQRLGRRLVQQLIWRSQNEDFPYETVYVSGELIFRKSSDRK